MLAQKTNYVILVNAFQAYLYNISKGMSVADALNTEASLIANLLNHEIGHSLGLWHTWNANDGFVMIHP